MILEEGLAWDVAAVVPRQGIVEYFVLDRDGFIHVRIRDRGHWSTWQVVNIAGNDHGRIMRVASASLQPGHRELMVVTDSGRLLHAWRQDGRGRPGSPARAVSVFRKLAEFQELFVVGDAGDLGHRHHQRGLDWSDWLVMDIPADVVDVAGSTTSPNSLRCLVVDSEGTLWVRPYDGVGTGG